MQSSTRLITPCPTLSVPSEVAENPHVFVAHLMSCCFRLTFSWHSLAWPVSTSPPSFWEVRRQTWSALLLAGASIGGSVAPAAPASKTVCTNWRNNGESAVTSETLQPMNSLA